MASTNRTNQINQMLKVLRKHFKPFKVTTDRTVLEHLLFACCLENSPHEEAETAFAALKEQFFDWNEIRVSTVRELAESMKSLLDADDSAIRLKRTLQSVFESIYSFDLEPLTKENIGKATERLEKHPGTTPFAVAYVTQIALGGHAIPVNQGLLLAFHVLGVINQQEFEKGTVPGLERAVPKSKGLEVASILHQLGVLVGRNPYSPAVRKILIEIEPQCKERLPKRPSKSAASRSTTGDTSRTKGKTTKKKTSRSETAPAGSAAKKRADKKAKPAADSKPGGSKKTKTSARSSTAKKKTKTATRRLAKSKPR